MKELNGIVAVKKERGYTSHDVVNVMRRILGTRKVGHTGTLDPNAEGVLPICVGRSTKVADLLVNSDKEYIAKVQLGITTDTYDIWGEVTDKRNVNVTYERLQSAVSEYIGDIKQLPPMYSAVKVNGKKLYELARKGMTAERKPRSITIYKSDILSFDGDFFELKVSCSKGTYIRSLCYDIGEKLGCGAAMTELVRTKSGVFDISEAHTLDEIKLMVDKNGADSVLLTPDCLFMQYQKLTVTDTVRTRLINGAISRSGAQTGKYRAYDNNDTFIGIVEVFESEKGNAVKSIKTFCNR